MTTKNTWQHAANEWADAATNGIQALKNVRDGISTADECIALLLADIEHARQSQPATQSPRIEDRAAGDVEVPAGTCEYRLRAMAENYANGHNWDRLDGIACLDAAQEIKALRAALASATPSMTITEPRVGWATTSGQVTTPSAAVGEGVSVAWEEERDCEQCDGAGGKGRLYGDEGNRPSIACEKCKGTGKLARALRPDTTHTKPGHMVVTIESESLPQGYSLGSDKKGSYWPLFDKGYIGNDHYESKTSAELAAWKHAHNKLAATIAWVHSMLVPALNATKGTQENKS